MSCPEPLWRRIRHGARPEVPRRLDAAIVALLALALLAFVVDRWVLHRPGSEPSPSVSGAEAPAPAVPVSAGSATPGPAASAAGVSGAVPVAADPRSVAVLPFVNMSGDADNEYFSDGLTEELLNVLARIEGLKVAARTSSFHFKGQSGNMGDIARQLGVAHLLEGSVRRSGERVRVTAQLINPADGFRLWSETYDRQMTDIFAIQDDIAAEVARALRVRLLGDVVPAVPRPPTGDMQAYTAYLRGKQALRIDSYEAFERADAAFREALALDPEFAAAHAALAETWRRRAFWGVVPWQDALKEVRYGVVRALELDPEQPLAWALDGQLKLADEDTEPSVTARLEAGERSLRRALELEPGQPQASESLAWVLMQRRRDQEALQILLAALERDPLSARVHGAIGDHYRVRGELEQAALRYQAAIELAPEDPLTGTRLVRTRYAQGRIGEAVALMANKMPLDPRDHEGPLVMAQFYLELGMTDAALEADLPERWASRQKFEAMVYMHEQAQGGFERSLARLLARAPTALDPVGAEEPVDTEAFFMKVNAVPLIRLRDGDAAARARATELLAHLERHGEGLGPWILGAARLTLYGILGRSDEAIAQVRALDSGNYAIDEWFWSQVDLSAWAEPEAPVVQAYLAEKEAVRVRERAWLAEPGRMPDPEAVLAAMARAAMAAPERVAPAEAGPDPFDGPR